MDRILRFEGGQQHRLRPQGDFLLVLEPSSLSVENKRKELTITCHQKAEVSKIEKKNEKNDQVVRPSPQSM